MPSFPSLISLLCHNNLASATLVCPTDVIWWLYFLRTLGTQSWVLTAAATKTNQDLVFTNILIRNDDRH